jgi:hypothetical protein
MAESYNAKTFTACVHEHTTEYGGRDRCVVMSFDRHLINFGRLTKKDIRIYRKLSDFSCSFVVFPKSGIEIHKNHMYLTLVQGGAAFVVPATETALPLLALYRQICADFTYV